MTLIIFSEKNYDKSTPLKQYRGKYPNKILLKRIKKIDKKFKKFDQIFLMIFSIAIQRSKKRFQIHKQTLSKLI